MLKKIYLFALFIICSSGAFAQQPVKPVQLTLKWHPFNLISPMRTYLQGSAELVLGKHYGIELGYGARIAEYGRDTQVVKAHGRNILAELKYHRLFIRPHAPKRHTRFRDHADFHDFAGISYRNIRDVHNKQLHYHFMDSSTNYYQKDAMDNIGVTTKLDIWCLRYGVAFSYGRIGVEGFIETGLKHKQISYSHNEYEAMGWKVMRSDFFMPEFPGDDYRLALNWAIRVTCRLY